VRTATPNTRPGRIPGGGSPSGVGGVGGGGVALTATQ
jgi:hypothetical protein